MLCEMCRIFPAVIKTKGINTYEDVLNVCRMCYYYIRWSKLNVIADSLDLYFEPFSEWYEKKTGHILPFNKYKITCKVR